MSQSQISQLRKLIREQLQRLVESTCPRCGDSNAYVGATAVECPNQSCRFFTQRQYDDVNASQPQTKIAQHGIRIKNPILIEYERDVYAYEASVVEYDGPELSHGTHDTLVSEYWDATGTPLIFRKGFDDCIDLADFIKRCQRDGSTHVVSSDTAGGGEDKLYTIDEFIATCVP